MWFDILFAISVICEIVESVEINCESCVFTIYVNSKRYHAKLFYYYIVHQPDTGLWLCLGFKLINPRESSSPGQKQDWAENCFRNGCKKLFQNKFNFQKMFFSKTISILSVCTYHNEVNIIPCVSAGKWVDSAYMAHGTQPVRIRI